MKSSRIALLPLAYCACLLLSATQTQALDPKGQIEDISQWTQDQVYGYLDKYNIIYDKNMDDKSLLDKIKIYRDSALETANIFVNEQAGAMNHLLNTIKITLEKNSKLSQNDVESFIDDIKHNLNELEIKGTLTEEKAMQSLDKLKHNAISKKHITEAQWKAIRADVEAAFANPTWYQRLMGTSHSFHDNSFYTWLEKNGIPQKLEKNSKLTKDQINGVTDVLKSSVESATSSASDLSKLGSKDWWAQVAKDIEKTTELKKDQVQDIVESMENEFYAYKIFAMDNMNKAAEGSQHIFAQAEGKFHSATSAASSYAAAAASDASSYASAAASDASKSATSLTKEAGNAAASATAAAADAANAASASVSSVQAQVTNTVYDTKDSFGNYWKQKELNAYRKIGYTEAHIDWVADYLSRTFHQKSTTTKDSIQKALQNIRQYLVDCKVQTEVLIDKNLEGIKEYYHKWNKNRDEL